MSNHKKKEGIYRPSRRDISAPVSYYYWDNNFRTKDDLTLKECYEKFGTKLVWAEKFYYKVVYLSEKKELGNSWMLWSKDITTDANIKVRLYEQDFSKIFMGDI
jgi:hypothetical protein